MNDRALSFLIHGGPRSGKSTFAVTSPAPRLILDVESASRFLTNVRKVKWDPITQEPPVDDGTWDTCVVMIHDFNTALKAYEWLKSGKHPFRSVILDSISELQVKAKEAVNGRAQMQTQHWGELLAKISFFGRDLRDLTTHPYNPLEAIVVIATTFEKDGVQKPYLQGQVANQIPYWYDINGYLYVDQVIDPTTQQPVEVRRLLTAKHPNFEAGSRVPGIDQVLTNPNIEALIEQVFGPRA